jgi:transcriptional regulator with XRE-family HTH domain
LRQWRKTQPDKVTLEQIAQSLDCTRAHVSLIEHYKLMPGLLLAFKLNVLTGVPMEKFVGPTDFLRKVSNGVKLADHHQVRREAARQRKTALRQG